jgi:uncharacterized membrane protein YfcA
MFPSVSGTIPQASPVRQTVRFRSPTFKTVPIELLILFTLVVLAGSYIQAVAGFAMGMLIIAALTSVRLLDVATGTAVVSLLSLANIGMSLHGHYHHVHGRVLRMLAFGQIPAVAVGLWLLEVLSQSAQHFLELLLGAFIVLGSLAMMLRPEPRATVSNPWACVVAGVAGGTLGGLFSASGPVLGWFSYRQPLAVNEIRATLLGCFAVTTLWRTILVGAAGGLTQEVWLLAATGLPIVFVGTWLGGRFAPPLSEASMRRVAFGLLLLMGGWILVGVARAV